VIPHGGVSRVFTSVFFSLVAVQIHTNTLFIAKQINGNKRYSSKIWQAAREAEAHQ